MAKQGRFTLQRSQWWSLFALAMILLFCAGAVIALYYDRVPDYVYSPTRYVFITDKLSDRMAVIDLDQGRQSDQQDLGMVPDMLAIASDFPIMAYANYLQKQLVFFNLKKKEQLKLMLPSPPIDMFFIPNRQRLLVVMQNTVALADYQRPALYPLTKPEQISQFTKTHLPVFSALDGSLWVADPIDPVIYRLRVNQRGAQWRSYALSLPPDTRLGPLSVNAQGSLLAFVEATGRYAYLYEPSTGTLHRTADFRRESNVSSVPYIDANSRWVVYDDGQERLIAVMASSDDTRIAVHLPFPAHKIRGGWLNRLWVITTQKGLAIQLNNADEQLHWFSLNGKVADLWVTGNGKTALLTLQAGLQQVLPFDLRTATQKPPIDLQGILQANLIRMGGNNSFCY